MATSFIPRHAPRVRDVIDEHGVHPQADSRAILRRWRRQRLGMALVAAAPLAAGAVVLAVAPTSHWPGVVLALPALMASGLLTLRSHLLRPCTNPLHEAAWALALALTVAGLVLASEPLAWLPWVRASVAITCGVVWLGSACGALLPFWPHPAVARLLVIATGCASLILIRLLSL
jgi:hypothetical protein